MLVKSIDLINKGLWIELIELISIVTNPPPLYLTPRPHKNKIYNRHIGKFSSGMIEIETTSPLSSSTSTQGKNKNTYFFI